MTYPELVRQLMDTDNVRIYDGATCTLEVAAATKCKPVIADVGAIDAILNESEEQPHGVSADTP